MPIKTDASMWLRPLNPIYAAVAAFRNMAYDRNLLPTRALAAPVISIGNLSTGGTGKTPFTAALAGLLLEAGQRPIILSRGYGRESKQAARVNAKGTAVEFGDEPLLLARVAPVYVASDRYRAGLLAAREQPITPTTVFLLDDGFQHRRLARNVDIVLLSRSDLNDSLLPGGNLREPLAALSRAHVLVLREEDAALASEFFQRFIRPSCSRPVLWMVRRSLDLTALPNSGACLAFAGIAHPRDFFDGLRARGVSAPATLAFPDHHFYSFADITRIIATLKAAKAEQFLTTEKDLVRLEPRARAALAATAPLLAVPLRTELLNPAVCLQQLDALCVRQS